ncbi:MAG: Uma2 family endonuclease [Clostridia bacterium]|nr:Uma2 family endonuclease [Clostridia bacterium]
MVDKLNTYMLSGVREYWIVDPKKQSILLYGFKERKVDQFHDFKAPDILKSYFFEGLQAGHAEVFTSE